MTEELFCTIAAGAKLPACDDRIAALYLHWLSLCPASGVRPGWERFDPRKIPYLLPWIWLVDVQRDPLRFKYRLVGAAQSELAKSDPTGRWLDEANARFKQSSAYALFQAVAERSVVSFYRGPPAYVIDANDMTVERLILPMARGGKTVDMLLGITVFDPIVSILLPASAGARTA
ncbi:MAG: PAS domain-containing protein [Bradyrhizobium sp.]